MMVVRARTAIGSNMVCDTCKTEQGFKGTHYKEDDKNKFRCTECCLAPDKAKADYKKSLERFMVGGKQTAVQIIKQKLFRKRKDSLLP
jgi:dissimilatory sulfite reductase (desulfoviridin) alpha/beta subunit